MAYKHGVYVSEVPTSILPAVTVDSAVPVIFGTAPVNMTDVTNVNRPVLCNSYEEFVAAFGFVPASCPFRPRRSRSSPARIVFFWYLSE